VIFVALLDELKLKCRALYALNVLLNFNMKFNIKLSEEKT